VSDDVASEGTVDPDPTAILHPHPPVHSPTRLWAPFTGSFKNGVENSIADTKTTIKQAKVGGLISATFKVAKLGPYDSCTLDATLPSPSAPQTLRVVSSRTSKKTVFYGGDFKLIGQKASDIAQVGDTSISAILLPY
jgi:hypothetical protein